MNFATFATQPETNSEFYVIRDAAGKVVARPLEGLDQIDRNNARDFTQSSAYKECPEIVNWFLQYTGTRSFNGKTRKNTLSAFAWIRGCKGMMPTLGSELLSYYQDEDGPTSNVLGYRLWSVYPALDWNDPDSLKQFDTTGNVPLKVLPVSQAIGVRRAEIEKTEHYDVPRIMYKNPIIVDYDIDGDGSVIPTRVRANYYARIQFKNRNWKRAFEVNGDLRQYDSQVFASMSNPKSIDCTDEFLEVYDTIEGPDVHTRVHATLGRFISDPNLKNSKLSRIMLISAYSLLATSVEPVPYEIKREYRLVDRVQMVAATVSDVYYGVERGDNRDDDTSFKDFYCRLVQLADPITKGARNLDDLVRANAGMKIIVP
jgi:hypothetical protein